MTAHRAARALAVAGALAWCAAAPAAAQDAAQDVGIQFAAFGPSQLDVLPGESVTWTNVSDRTHTVTSDTGAFGSGELAAGSVFSVRFADPGAYPYHCTLHPAMTGEIDARGVILGPLPTAVVPAGQPIEVTGRTADPGDPVTIERSLDGQHFAPAGSAVPAPDGTWHATIVADVTGDYRASSPAGPSQTRRMLVSSRKVHLRATRAGVQVTVTPSDPYARIMLQRLVRDRFGWWPVARTRLDYVSGAAFRVRGPARLRAVLVDRDGWTALARSPVLVLGR